MVSTTKRILQFLERSSLSITKIEKEAGLPAKTINKAISTGKEIPEKHIPEILSVIRKYGYTNERATVISIVNNKGGVGKTTTTINVGKALALLGNKVLLVDMDAQGNLSQCFDIHVVEQQVIDSLLDRKPLLIHPIENDENLFLAPSDIRMSYREPELFSAIGSDRRLALTLDEHKNDFDYILIDCPPANNIITTNCLVASDSCIIPIQPEASAYFGVENLLNRIKEIRDFTNPKLTVNGIVFTLVQKNQRVHRELMEHIHETLKGYRIFATAIDLSTAIKQSQVAKEDIFTYAPQSKSAEQYRSLAQEIIE